MSNDIAAAIARLKALCERREYLKSVPESHEPGSHAHKYSSGTLRLFYRNNAAEVFNLLPALLAAFDEQGRELERLRMENIRLMAELAGQPPPPVEVVTTTGNHPDQEIREQG